MTYHHQWIYIQDALGDAQEFVNGARTAAYLDDVYAGGSVDIDGVLAFGGCESYVLKPCTANDDLTVDEWLPMSFTTPDAEDDPAPWYDGTPGSASTEALGMWIEEWTGLDGGHHTRSVKPVAGAHRAAGARFGPQSARHRVWAMNMILFGTSERGLEYLFRWVEQTLLACCDPCSETSMWVRLTCPEMFDPEDGIYLARNVALLEGPTWQDEPVEGAGCTIRRISFVLGVGDPCLYAPMALAAASQTVNVNDEIQNNSQFGLQIATHKPKDFRPACDAISPTGKIVVPIPTADIGFTSPIVTIRTGPGGGLPELRIIGLEDMTGTGDDECYGRVLGEVDTARLPADSTLQIDFGRREVLYKDSTTGGFVPGWAFIMPNSIDRRRWFSFTCRDSYVIIEPNSLNYAYSAPNIVDATGAIMSFTTTPSVDVWAARRVGCC